MTAPTPTPTPTSAAPAANARTLGLAHYAARGVLEHFLSLRGLTFQQHLTLRTAAGADAPQTRERLVEQVRSSIKADPAGIRATLDELLAAGLLVEDGARLRPTDAGRELLAAVAEEVAPVSARIWGGLPADDMAAAGRLLALIARRADEELATLTA
ncbi:MULTISPECIES: MarR family transcriptional regulator [unclassified Streptomyces]|uniref:MarR family transcriptional regulator n=1 Tax=unclassified Streptomyces TaxID=2593676 RepID=UPI0011C72BF9|nr:MarR family transcriptional regulator [Streptomyces sp. wa22]TXS18864.1 MarR family transcriptional regulator [Streptomyces sp. wa22]